MAREKLISSLVYSFFLPVIWFIIFSIPEEVEALTEDFMDAFADVSGQADPAPTVEAAGTVGTVEPMAESMAVDEAASCFMFASIFFKASAGAPIFRASSIAFWGSMPFAISFIFSRIMPLMPLALE